MSNGALSVPYTRARSIISGLRAGIREARAVLQAAKEKPIREVYTTETEVLDAFNILVDKNPRLILRFKEAFVERAKVPELSESRGREGLVSVLAGLSRRFPPESCFDLSRNGGDGFSFKDDIVDSFFADELRFALTSVGTQYPRALLTLKRHAQETRKSLPEFLGALLVLYTDNKTVYPF